MKFPNPIFKTLIIAVCAAVVAYSTLIIASFLRAEYTEFVDWRYWVNMDIHIIFMLTLLVGGICSPTIAIFFAVFSIKKIGKSTRDSLLLALIAIAVSAIGAYFYYGLLVPIPHSVPGPTSPPRMAT